MGTANAGCGHASSSSGGHILWGRAEAGRAAGLGPGAGPDAGLGSGARHRCRPRPPAPAPAPVPAPAIRRRTDEAARAGLQDWSACVPHPPPSAASAPSPG
ncbi:hypothetical protein FM112_03740 [Gulosibacter sp. 10]|nr:hypothetical protein FM112_03740 [Gulosibacter sp. 10]